MMIFLTLFCFLTIFVSLHFQQCQSWLRKSNSILHWHLSVVLSMLEAQQQTPLPSQKVAQGMWYLGFNCLTIYLFVQLLKWINRKYRALWSLLICMWVGLPYDWSLWKFRLDIKKNFLSRTIVQHWDRSPREVQRCRSSKVSKIPVDKATTDVRG